MSSQLEVMNALSVDMKSTHLLMLTIMKSFTQTLATISLVLHPTLSMDNSISGLALQGPMGLGVPGQNTMIHS
jgi:hypothetical protein